MATQSWSIRRSIGLGTTLCILAGMVGNAAVAVAQSKPTTPKPTAPKPAKQPTTTRRVSFVLPTLPNVGRSSNRRGAATRSGSCPAVTMPLTALAPVQMVNGEPVVVSLTTANRPTLWFYVPYAITPDRPAELRVEAADPTSGLITQRRVATLTNAAPGVVGIRLPSTEAELQPGQLSNWTFVVRCNPKDASANKFVEVSLQRVQIDRPLTTQIAAAQSRQQIILFAQAGIWENSITTLATLRQRSPRDPDLAADWADLMSSVDLPDIANQPIVKLHTP